MDDPSEQGPDADESESSTSDASDRQSTSSPSEIWRRSDDVTVPIDISTPNPIAGAICGQLVKDFGPYDVHFSVDISSAGALEIEALAAFVSTTKLRWRVLMQSRSSGNISTNPSKGGGGSGQGGDGIGSNE